MRCLAFVASCTLFLLFRLLIGVALRIVCWLFVVVGSLLSDVCLLIVDDCLLFVVRCWWLIV